MRAKRLTALVGTIGLAAVLAGCERPQIGWQTELVSVSADGESTGNGVSNTSDISPDGTKVAFETRASDLGATDTNGNWDIYVRDLDAGTTTLVSTNAAGTDSGNAGSLGPAFSPDGRLLTFTTAAEDMDSADTDGESDIYIADLETGDVGLLSA